ncbi:MAG: ABC transporter permease [Syntrophobacterales bacterium]|nr:ABC transporter permease [Syntrophobacterales bacterium]
MKTLATVKKEFLLVIRDPGGLAMLFFMPLILVIVMTLIQDNTFREFQESSLDILFIDQDQGELGKNISQALQATGHIHLISTEEGEPVTAERAHYLVQKGIYKAAVIIPPDATTMFKEKIKHSARLFLASYGLAPRPAKNKQFPPQNIDIIYDPVIKANYRMALTEAMEKMLTGLQTDWLITEIQKRFDGITGKKGGRINLSAMIEITQKSALEDDQRAIPLTAVQHNVPAWSMFAMFFILYPLAGNFIREREDGSMMRLRLIAGSSFSVIAGKFGFYLTICLLQLVTMLAAGLYLMPMLGLSKLALGSNYAGIILAGLAVAMAATGYGLFIAVYFKTAQQALSFGAISIVILSAIGGIWVPVLVMPPIMQELSPFSPLNWGLSAFNDLFIRNTPTADILPSITKLMAFAVLTLTASILVYKSRLRL